MPTAEYTKGQVIRIKAKADTPWIFALYETPVGNQHKVRVPLKAAMYLGYDPIVPADDDLFLTLPARQVKPNGVK